MPISCMYRMLFISRTLGLWRKYLLPVLTVFLRNVQNSPSEACMKSHNPIYIIIANFLACSLWIKTLNFPQSGDAVRYQCSSHLISIKLHSSFSFKSLPRVLLHTPLIEDYYKGASICSYNPLQGFQKIKCSGHNSWAAVLIAVWCGHCGHLLQAAGHWWRLPTRQGSDPAQEPHLHLPHGCCHGKEKSQQLRPQQVRIEHRQETSTISLLVFGKLLTRACPGCYKQHLLPISSISWYSCSRQPVLQSFLVAIAHLLGNSQRRPAHHLPSYDLHAFHKKLLRFQLPWG